MAEKSTVEQVIKHFLATEGQLDTTDRILINLMRSGKIEAFGKIDGEIRFRSKEPDIIIEGKIK